MGIKKNNPGCDCCGCLPVGVTDCDDISYSTNGPLTYELVIPGDRGLDISGSLAWDNVDDREFCCTMAQVTLTEDIIDQTLNNYINAIDEITGDRFCQTTSCSSQDAVDTDPPTASFDFYFERQTWDYYRLQTQYKGIKIISYPGYETWANSNTALRGAEYEGSRCGLWIGVFVEIDARQAAEAFDVFILDLDRSGTLTYLGSPCSAEMWSDYCGRQGSAGGSCLDDETQTIPDITSESWLNWYMYRKTFVPGITTIPTGPITFDNNAETSVVSPCLTTGRTHAPEIITNEKTGCIENYTVEEYEDTCYVNGVPTSTKNYVNSYGNIAEFYEINGTGCSPTSTFAIDGTTGAVDGLGFKYNTWTRTIIGGLPLNAETFFTKSTGSWILTLA